MTQTASQNQLVRIDTKSIYTQFFYLELSEITALQDLHRQINLDYTLLNKIKLNKRKQKRHTFLTTEVEKIEKIYQNYGKNSDSIEKKIEALNTIFDKERTTLATTIQDLRTEFEKYKQIVQHIDGRTLHFILFKHVLAKHYYAEFSMIYHNNLWQNGARHILPAISPGDEGYDELTPHEQLNSFHTLINLGTLSRQLLLLEKLLTPTQRAELACYLLPSLKHYFSGTKLSYSQKNPENYTDTTDPAVEAFLKDHTTLSQPFWPAPLLDTKILRVLDLNHFDVQGDTLSGHDIFPNIARLDADYVSFTPPTPLQAKKNKKDTKKVAKRDHLEAATEPSHMSQEEISELKAISITEPPEETTEDEPPTAQMQQDMQRLDLEGAAVSHRAEETLQIHPRNQSTYNALFKLTREKHAPISWDRFIALFQNLGGTVLTQNGNGSAHTLTYPLKKSEHEYQLVNYVIHKPHNREKTFGHYSLQLLRNYLTEWRLSPTHLKMI